ncbi:leucine efflux protein LeuE [Streptomyces sp. NEAU-S7GS2]|uniref:leucine efflux protein LeuE n=1 Tax=Streptomyces sp. NEAU-S7GS2 TaxID=2202000 RepID=UPI000D6EE365|nr:leucine efflux protein LeuE [Streptomyces sp. NEAU-S7GS2]AWN31232.1 leucine efflux protein LeuE [Streptomyces sp. NEAU-S7GS2]
MLGVENLLTYALGALLIIVLPGPSSLFTLSAAARLGVRAGYRAATGVFLGESLLMVATAGGLASLLQTNELLFAIVKYAGAGYLTWIAVGMIRAAWTMWRRHHEKSAEEAAATPAPSTGGRLFRRSLVITVLNPKAILFFISFFVQFVDPQYAHSALSFALLALVYQVISIAYVTVLILGGTYLATQFRRRKLSAGLTTGAGALFLGFAAKLATTSN